MKAILVKSACRDIAEKPWKKVGVLPFRTNDGEKIGSSLAIIFFDGLGYAFKGVEIEFDDGDWVFYLGVTTISENEWELSGAGEWQPDDLSDDHWIAGLMTATDRVVQFFTTEDLSSLSIEKDQIYFAGMVIGSSKGQVALTVPDGIPWGVCYETNPIKIEMLKKNYSCTDLTEYLESE